jgi:hypothetical protein
MELQTSASFNCSADKIWTLLEDFGAIAAWWPTEGPIRIRTVDIEGDGVGMIRHIYNEGMDTPVSERLDYMDPTEYTLILSIVGDRPAGITGYVAIGKLRVTSENSCELHYQGYVTCPPENAERVAKNIQFTWQTMFAGLQQKAYAS